jgi:hypothetical protein
MVLQQQRPQRKAHPRRHHHHRPHHPHPPHPRLRRSHLRRRKHPPQRIRTPLTALALAVVRKLMNLKLVTMHRIGVLTVSVPFKFALNDCLVHIVMSCFYIVRFIPYSSYYTAIQYFTGSGEFNRRLRIRANELGYTLNGTTVNVPCATWISDLTLWLRCFAHLLQNIICRFCPRPLMTRNRQVPVQAPVRLQRDRKYVKPTIQWKSLPKRIFLVTKRFPVLFVTTLIVCFLHIRPTEIDTLNMEWVPPTERNL